LLEEYDYIFSVHASSKLSGTFQSACIARDTLEKESIEVIDTCQVTMCQGFVALAAARAALGGAGPDEARNTINEAMDSARLLFTVDTLEFLAKHGRIGKAASMLGTMMSVKPIARIIDGEVTPVAKTYGRRSVLSRVLNLMNQEIGPGQAIHASIVHADSAGRAAEWSERIESEFNCREMIITECGPVVGTHAGPGAIGVAWLPSK
jgi:DegV family protein with EDD domain